MARTRIPGGGTVPDVQPIFDGHHDALTRETASQLAGGRPDGHFDLPRAQRGGLVASIWAIFTPNPGPEAEPALTGATAGGGYDEPLAEPITHEDAAAYATACAGRLLALERAGHV